jgi:hypothetical protein
MPIYRYEHEDTQTACEQGVEFELSQSIKADRLTECPACHKPVQRLIPKSFSVASVRSNAELRNLGMTKLVRRDSGVYEDVTKTEGGKRIIDAND